MEWVRWVCGILLCIQSVITLYSVVQGIRATKRMKIANTAMEMANLSMEIAIGVLEKAKEKSEPLTSEEN